MPDFNFYDENNHALQQCSVVTRDSLGSLAVAILASMVDLSKETDYAKVITELNEIVKELHHSYEKVYPYLT